MTFGKAVGFGEDFEVSREVFNAFIDAGGNFIDTANVYSRGGSEEIVGSLLRGMRERVVLSTKYSSAMNRDDPNSGGNHRKNLRHSVENSLKRLQTDYIDIYYTHLRDPRVRIHETMRALEDLVKAGKVLHIGLANTPAWVMASGNAYANAMGLSPVSCAQINYSLLERSAESTIFPFARYDNVAVVAHSPLAGGWLSGKYSSWHPAAASGTRRLDETDYWTKGYFARADAQTAIDHVIDIAREVGLSPAQLSLAWMLQRPGMVVIPAIGARNVEQLRHNLGCVGVELAPVVIERLDGLLPPRHGTPEVNYFHDSDSKLLAASKSRLRGAGTIFA